MCKDRIKRTIGILAALAVLSPAATAGDGSRVPPRLRAPGASAGGALNVQPLPNDDVPVTIETPPALGAAGDLMLFQAIVPSPAVRQVMADMGFQSIPIMGPWRHSDPEGNFDPARYQQNIWRPDVLFDIPPGFGDHARYGIAPGYTGWVILDYEHWDILNHLNDFAALINFTRMLRPGVKICMYWVPRLDANPPYRQAEATILGMADAISPPVYLLNNLENLTGQLYNRQERVRYCLELGQELNKLVMPIVWKRFPAGIDEDGKVVQLFLPPPLLDDLVQVALLNHEGLQADGLIVWGNDSLVLYQPDDPRVHPDTPTQFSVDLTDLSCVQIVTSASAEQEQEQPSETGAK